MLEPAQIALVPLVAVTEIGVTETVTISVDEHPLISVPVTVYVVVVEGDAVGLAIAALSNDADGVHK